MEFNLETHMNFPYEPKYLIHSSGSKILKILKLTHEIYPPENGNSYDIWCAICVVEWCDTKKTSESSIVFNNICYSDPNGHAELLKLSKAMNAYLVEHGSWNHKDPKRPFGWTAHRRLPKTA